MRTMPGGEAAQGVGTGVPCWVAEIFILGSE